MSTPRRAPVADLLEAVADLLEEHGFTTGRYPYESPADGYLTFEAAVDLLDLDREPTVLAEPGNRMWLREVVLAELRPLFAPGMTDVTGPIRDRAAELRRGCDQFLAAACQSQPPPRR